MFHSTPNHSDGASGQLRHQFADFHAGDIGRDRHELAAELFRGRRLQVEGVHVCWTTGQIDIDDRFAGCPCPRLLFRLQQLRKAEPADGQSANLQEVSPTNAIAEPVLPSEECQHGCRLR
jgi:hypothetical protein